MLRSAFFLSAGAVGLLAGGVTAHASPDTKPAPAATAADSAQAQEVKKPEAIVRGIADHLADKLQGRRDELKRNKEELVDVIDDIFLPHFDIDYASILVLGRHARDISPKKRERFAKAFYNSITERYAKALTNYTRGSVQVLPRRGELNDQRTIVRSRVKTDNGDNVSVNYAFRKTSDGQWKVYDVIVEGISYITNYRNQVDAEIRDEGIDALIKRLEDNGKDALKDIDSDKSGG